MPKEMYTGLYGRAWTTRELWASTEKAHVFTKKYIVVSFLDKQYVGPALILISWVTLMNEIHRNGTAQGEQCVDCNKKSNLSNKRPSTCLTVK